MLLQATQVTPKMPQAPSALLPTPGLWQVPLKSQHPVQLDGLHGPPLSGDPGTQAAAVQTWPAGQTEQARPDWPQAAVVLPCWHTPLRSQHPVAQLEGRHCGTLDPQPRPTHASAQRARKGAMKRSMGFPGQ